MLRQDKFPVLMKLRSENQGEFRHQIMARLKNIASDKDLTDFVAILSQFRKEFITDSCFYIDVLNDVVRNLLAHEKKSLQGLLDQFVFIAEIGDTHTHELLNKVLNVFARDNDALSRLQKSMLSLENKLRRFEKDSDDFKLYPMLEIEDQWME
ncbi:MAG TPA: hypothetical protein ENI73_07525 [Spirochaetes bacterium]|nr:hypothetical protein [Spirochaetota bacterium]